MQAPVTGRAFAVLPRKCIGFISDIRGRNGPRKRCEPDTPCRSRAERGPENGADSPTEMASLEITGRRECTREKKREKFAFENAKDANERTILARVSAKAVFARGRGHFSRRTHATEPSGSGPEEPPRSGASRGSHPWHRRHPELLPHEMRTLALLHPPSKTDRPSSSLPDLRSSYDSPFVPTTGNLKCSNKTRRSHNSCVYLTSSLLLQRILLFDFESSGPLSLIVLMLRLRRAGSS